MTGRNRLASATSPYLLQHAENPVHWWQWSDDAFDEATERQVPVFLSVGYAACHWCHVMAHESFEDQQTASMINDHFVPIKVDREERPDVDAVYMQATQALTGQGGWPMSVFLTPDRKPFYAGTYFPPTPRHGLPSFPQVLQAISEAWRDRRSELLRECIRDRSPAVDAADAGWFGESDRRGLREGSVHAATGVRPDVRRLRSGAQVSTIDGARGVASRRRRASDADGWSDPRGDGARWDI